MFSLTLDRGSIEGYFPVHEGAQKVLVGSYHYFVVVAGNTHRIWWRLGRFSFHLHLILI